jgi:hypothetical protein
MKFKIFLKFGAELEGFYPNIRRNFHRSSSLNDATHFRLRNMTVALQCLNFILNIGPIPIFYNALGIQTVQASGLDTQAHLNFNAHQRLPWASGKVYHKDIVDLRHWTCFFETRTRNSCESISTIKNYARYLPKSGFAEKQDVFVSLQTQQCR